MTKKYILKPGKHQFAPGSHPVHDNDSLTDAEAEWYLAKYPHILNLFVQLPVEKSVDGEMVGAKSDKTKRKSVIKEVSVLTLPTGSEEEI